MSDDKVLTVEEAKITPCDWHGHKLSDHQWNDTVDGYQRCVNCKHVRHTPATPAPETEPKDAIARVKEVYPDARLCSKSVTTDEGYKGPNYWIEAIGMRPLRRTFGSPTQAWKMTARSIAKRGHPEAVISDGFGNIWDSRCPTCGQDAMEVVRPGKTQCAAETGPCSLPHCTSCGYRHELSDKCKTEPAERPEQTHTPEVFLRQFEWDENQGDTPFNSANAAVRRHNREIKSVYVTVCNNYEALRDSHAKLIRSMELFQGYYESDFFCVKANDGRTLADWYNTVCKNLTTAKKVQGL